MEFEDNSTLITEGMSLSEALKRGLVDVKTGKFSDRFSGRNVKLSEAVKRGLLNAHWLEIYDASKKCKISLKEALERNIVNDGGKYNDKMSLQEALKKNFICAPMTLKECDDKELLLDNGKSIKFLDNKNLTLKDAIDKGVLDLDLKSVKDVKTGQLVSLAQALSAKIIDPEKGTFQDDNNEVIDLKEAVRRGHLTTVTKKSIFDIEAIKDQNTGDYVSFNKAIKLGIIDKITGKFLDVKTKHKISFKEAVDKDLLQPQLLEMLQKPIGIYSADKKRELSLLEAVNEGLIDSHSGLLINTATTNTVPMDKALELQLITPMGVAVLKSLLNITVTTATVTQTVKRYIQVSTAERDSGAITFQDALRRGLIDDSTGIFTHPDTGKELLLDEAIHLGLLKLSPSSSLKSSPIASSDTSNKRTILKQRKESQLEFNNGSTRSASCETKSSSSRVSTSSHKSSSLTRKSSRASEFRNIPIEISGKNSVPSTPGSPTKSSVISFGAIPDMPASGWSLKEAIEYKLFDTVNGKYQGSISLYEAISQGKINATSATVATTDDNGKGITLTLKKALEAGVVTADGQYNDGRKLIPMQDAIMNGKIWHLWKSSAQRAKENAQALKSKKKPINGHAKNGLDNQGFEEIAKGILYNKATNTYKFAKDITAADLLQALKDGKIRPQDIHVKLKNEQICNIGEAIRDGILDKSSGVYTCPQDEKMSLLQAIHADYIFIVSSSAAAPLRPSSINLNPVIISDDQAIGTPMIRNGTIKARIVESGVTTTRISTFMVEVPETGEEITLEEAVKRGLVSPETAALYQEEISTDSKVQSLIVLITCPVTGTEMPSQEAIAQGIVTQEEVDHFLRMSKKRTKMISSCSSTSNSSDEASFRSEITIDFGDTKNETLMRSSSVSVLLKQGYVLSNFDEVRNLKTGETMSIYEAKLRGIATDVKGQQDIHSSNIKVTINEAMARGLVSFNRGTFTNPYTSQEMTIAEAIKLGILITEIKTNDMILDCEQMNFSDALTSSCFDFQTRTFMKKESKQSLKEALETNWINGQDIVYDVSSSTCWTLTKAVEQGLINGQTCDYKINENQMMFILDAANAGHCALFAEPEIEEEHSEITYSLKEALDKVYDETSSTFNNQTMSQALRSGLIDFRSAQVLNTAKQCKHHLLEAIDLNILNGKTSQVTDVAKGQTMSLRQADQVGLLSFKDDEHDDFECLSIWEAIERQQLDTSTGMFYSRHEEKKTMTLEEAIYRRYIDKKSALVRDTWKRQFLGLSEATRKKIIKHGQVMNTTTGKYVNIAQAIQLDLLVKEIKMVSLIEMLDYGMYLPHSGRICIPGLEDREMTLGEAIDLKLIDHTRTIVKSRSKTNRYISLYEAIKVEGVIDSLTGLYAGSMNLLEARSKGYLLSIDAMVFIADKKHA